MDAELGHELSSRLYHSYYLSGKLDLYSPYEGQGVCCLILALKPKGTNHQMIYVGGDSIHVVLESAPAVMSYQSVSSSRLRITVLSEMYLFVASARPIAYERIQEET